jgi:piezo-type mechanosensitive ion channel component 1/2
MFSSYYFCHVINEIKASLILASRGNELIDELRQKEMKAEAEREAAILQKIKMKMDRIKATQQRVLEEHEPKHHAAGKYKTFIFIIFRKTSIYKRDNVLLFNNRV